MCFIAGIRDYIIVRDTFLLKGLIAFGVVAWIAFPISGLLGGEFVGEFGRPVLQTILLAAVGGFGVGYVSVLANGCPFRQHVLAAQGTSAAMAVELPTIVWSLSENGSSPVAAAVVAWPWDSLGGGK
jgi:hypothetical protein